MTTLAGQNPLELGPPDLGQRFRGNRQRRGAGEEFLAIEVIGPFTIGSRRDCGATQPRLPPSSNGPEVRPAEPVRKASDMPGYSINRDDYLKRLRRIEGQVRGLQRMIEEDKYCIDVLTQITSVTSALRSVGLGLLDEHIRHCVMDAADTESDHGDAKITEAVGAIERLLRA